MSKSETLRHRSTTHQRIPVLYPAPEEKNCLVSYNAGPPTLLVCAVVLCCLFYLYLPPTHHTEPGLLTYCISVLLWVGRLVHHWLGGPAILGVIVTLVTMAVMKYDSVGGPKIQNRNSLHLDTVVAVMNGGLVFLYGLFYNLKVGEQ